MHEHHHHDSCGCGHSHEKDEKSQRLSLIRIILSAALLFVIMALPIDGFPKTLLFLIPYLIAGYDILLEAAEGIFKGKIFDENFLMAVATIGAFLIGETSEGVFVLIFYQTGELFQSYALGKSKKSIDALMDIRPDVAYIQKGGNLSAVKCEEVQIGTEIVVSPGGRIPIDGVITEGESSLDLSALTGESLPKEVGEGTEVFSGSINLSSVLKIKTTKAFSDSTAAKIIELIESAGEKKSKSEKFITRFSKVYTPIVCISALILAVLPPLLGYFISGESDFKVWLLRALSFLVISCPCALVMSIPMSFFGGIGAGSKNGILIKSSDVLERLVKTKAFVFDKTGTLTKGQFAATDIEAFGIEKEELLKYSAHAEAHSTHPLATGIRNSYKDKINLSEISEVKEKAGHGVTATVFGKNVAVGSKKLMESLSVTINNGSSDVGSIYVAVNGELKGLITLSDTLKETTKRALNDLKALNTKTVMLTGDSKAIAEKIAKEAGIDEVYSELLPSDKLSILEGIIEKKEENSFVSFVGDGINDAPALTRSDIGIAMGSLGSDAAIEGADVVLMDDDLMKIPLAVKISKKTMKIVKENIVFSIGVKAFCLLLTAFGLASMWLAIFADVGVMVIAVLNAMRALK